MLGKKRIVGIVLATTLIAGALVAGTALAADPPAQPYRDDVLARVATILGVDQTRVEAAFTQAHTEILDQAVKDGRLTQQQADWMKQHQQAGYAGCGMGYGPGFQGGPGFMMNNGGHMGPGASYGPRWAPPTPTP